MGGGIPNENESENNDEDGEASDFHSSARKLLAVEVHSNFCGLDKLNQLHRNLFQSR